MCTYAIFVGAHPAAPVVVAGNRDELLDREATGPLVLDGPRGIVGGRDVRGGTWLAVRRDGRMVAVTNHRTWQPANPALRSRGVLPIALLAESTLDDGLEALRGVDARAYNAFHLVLADGARAFVADSATGEARVRITELAPGLHVLANVDFGAPGQARVNRASVVASEAAARATELDALADGLRIAFGDHTPPDPAKLVAPPPGSPATPEFVAALERLCIHVDAPIRYGTRSFAFVALAPDEVRKYAVTAGAPHASPLVDFTALGRS